MEKETLYQSTELRNDIDMDVVETFLIERGTPNDVMDSLNSGQKISIYESLISQDDYEDFLFNKL